MDDYLDEDPLAPASPSNSELRPPASLSNSELSPPAIDERGLLTESGNYVVALSEDPDNPKADRLYKFTTEGIQNTQYADFKNASMFIKPHEFPYIPVRKPINKEENDNLVSFASFGSRITIAKMAGKSAGNYFQPSKSIKNLADRREQEALQARQQRPWWRIWGGKSRKGKTRKTRKSKSRKSRKARKTRRR